ncbi:hypothetical protein [Paenibacillus silvisoli]|uniref:hypothetical protein n=1 Tax=Paenibacillus silvisoli TaxID=3110539 RepID=UPI0028064B52|nr:hypothetical protein [Paenibacillus silvisoli]
MPKTKRGRVLWSLPSRGRGTCPVCSRTRAKLLYPRAKSDGTAIKVCKRCIHSPQASVDSVTG